MCGIAGAITSKPLDGARLLRVLDRMRTRGPDGCGHAVLPLGGRALSLMHTRLSIVDLDIRSDQPFRKHGMTLIYNGEVYNYPELRDELKNLGAVFETTGDTEVILEAYRHWGADAVKRFEGMWAFALHDPGRDVLLLSRDRFGEKPLYLWSRPEGLYFASEVKALAVMAGETPAVNAGQIRRYLVNGYKSLYAAGETFHQGVEEFPAGTFAEVQGDGAVSPRSYWSLGYAPVEMSLEEAAAQARDRVVDAIEYRLRADVPVAVRLSGGIDSNIIAGVAQNVLGRQVTAFSILDDDPRYDETASIMQAVDYFGCDHHAIRIPETGFLDRMERLVDYFDGPLMTISYYLHALVSEAIHEAGFKVSLGGTGADELFSGYYDHYLFWLASQKDRPDFDALVAEWRGTYGRFVRNPFLQNPRAFIEKPAARDHIFLGAERFAGFLNEPFAEPHSERHYSDDPLRGRMLNELFVETVPVMLHEDDLAAMAFSVENRAAFLDSRLAEFLSTVPTRHLVHGGLPKYLMRQAGQGIAAPEIMANPRKQGINAPVTNMIDVTDPAVRAAILDNSPFYDIVDRKKVEAFLGQGAALNSESKFLFSLISAKLFIDGAATADL